MKKLLRIYVDTSVIGGCFDREFSTWSRGLLSDFRLERFTPVISDVTAGEIKAAPPRVQKVFEELQRLGGSTIAVSEPMLALFERYLRHRILPPRYRNDMLHIAVATVARADLLVSWNFRHIVRFDRIRAFNEVNEAAGYAALAIHSPREVTTYEAP